MLYLDQPIGLMEGMMIYRDHQDKSTFYYAVERPRLATNEGVPEFLFLKYKRDITDNVAFDPDSPTALGGGFLSFTVDLGVDKEVYDKVKGKLSRFAEGGEVKLSPIQFRSGSVRLSIVQERSEVAAEEAPADAPAGVKFFEKVYGASKPSLFGENRATFSVALSQEGATLLEAAFRSGISPIGVIYDLKFLAMRPAFNVRITAEYKRIYEHLEMEFGAKGQIYAVSLGLDIGAAFQKLLDEGAIKVEVLSFSDDTDLRSKADAAFEWFKTEMLKDFFNTSLQPPSFMTRTSGGLLSQLQSLFGSLNTSQGGASLTPQFGAPAQQGTAAARPQAQDAGVAPAGDANRQAAAVGAGQSGAGGAQGAGGAGGANPASPFQIAFSLKFYRQEELKRRVFEYSMQAAVEWNIAPQGMFSTIVKGMDLRRQIREVNLDDEFFRRLVSTVSVAGDLDEAQISKVAINLEYPASTPPGAHPSATDGFTFETGALTPRTFNAWINAAKELTYRYQVELHFKPTSPWLGTGGSVRSEWLSTRARQLVLNPLDYAELYPVQITWGDTSSGLVREAHVEVVYEDPAHALRRSALFILKPGDAGHTFKLRLSDPGLRTVSYRITWFFEEGQRLTSPWLTRDDGTIAVNDPFAGPYTVRVVPMLDKGALVEAIIEVQYREPDTGYGRTFRRVYTSDSVSSEDVKLFHAAAAPGPYQYEVTVIRTDGSVFQKGPVTSSDPAILVTDGEGLTRFVNVKLLDSNLAGAGLAAVRVELTGEGDEPDHDEVLFTESQVAPRRVLVVQPKNVSQPRYRFQITGYTALGQVISGASGESASSDLLVPLPRP